MDRFGNQSLEKIIKRSLVEKSFPKETAEEYKKISEVLCRFQEGYALRDLGKVDAFFEELFVSGEEISILGTSTEELLLGREEVKQLIRDDWEYWGDVNIHHKEAEIFVEGQIAWVTTIGSVKYSFQDTPERYDSYVEFIRKKVEEEGFTAKEKIGFINWVLALTYHQREEKKREYLWPLGLSGMLLKEDGKWKIAHLHFSISRANFPDERFEASKEYLEKHHKQKQIAEGYKNNQITEEVKMLLKNLEKEFTGQNYTEEVVVKQYFAAEDFPCILGTQNQWYDGLDNVREFFHRSSISTLSLDLDHAIAWNEAEVTWVTVIGVVKQKWTEEELAEYSLKEIKHVFEAKLSSKEKLFAAHRSAAYALKEGAIGENYSCPIRLTAVLSRKSTGLVFRQMHFSFPFNWIFEGKLNGNKAAGMKEGL